ASVHAPSKKRIIKATAVALLVAAAVLFTSVLPAEYGVDLLGTEKALGLIDLANATAAKPAAKPAETEPLKAGEAIATITPVLEPSPDGGAPVMKGAFIAQS